MRDIILTAAALWLAVGGNKAMQGKPQGNVPNLKTRELPDGTGTIGLPPGWTIDGSYRGSCKCNGPEGSAVIMGFPWTIQLPDHPIRDTGITVPGPMARKGDLAGALREVLKSNKNRIISIRSRPGPEGLPGVPAVYFLYEYESKGKRLTGLGYFSSISGDDNTLPYWQLYSSAVIAPKERFIKDLPTMMAIWNSWRPNGKKPKAGSEGAMLDAVITDATKRRAETLKEQQESFDRMNARFQQALNGP